VLIFGAYIAVITEETGKALDMHLDWCLILLGAIFSVAWLLVIYGSKSWQKNWEEHINKLEDRVTGPLYKTIYCTKKPYYSVSKINEILAWAVIGVWVILLLECIVRKAKIFGGIFINIAKITKDCLVPISFAAAVFCIIFLCIKGQSNKGNYRIKRGNNKDKGFINIGKKNQKGRHR
jgi:hypothetical protein